MNPDVYFDIQVDYSTRDIAVRGEFDAATAPCLATAVARFQRARLGDITIHLDGVTYIDAAGLDAVANARCAQANRGVSLTVAGATATVRNAFDRARLAGLLQPDAA